MADAIAEHFYDAAAGQEIAAALRAEIASGDYDAPDAAALAARLTARLSPLDGHLRVEWAGPDSADRSAQPGPGIQMAPRLPPRPAPSGAPGAGPASGPGPDRVDAVERRPPIDVPRRTAYGVRQIERLAGNLGYLRLDSFANIDFGAADDPARAMADAALTTLRGADGVIIDLRNNGGGAPSMVGYLVSAFVSADADVYNRFRTRSETESEAPAQKASDPMASVPLVILISGRTGSAAEAFAYTLQAAKRAVVVGQRSAGAANPGGLFNVGDGLSVFVPTGSPQNPLTGGNWEETGVAPDVEVDASQALDAALHRLLSARIATGDATPDSAWALAAINAPQGGKLDAGLQGRYGQWLVRQVGSQLQVEQGRRPALSLARLEPDLYFVVGQPELRFHFVREGDHVVALERASAWGQFARESRQSRDGEPH